MKKFILIAALFSLCLAAKAVSPGVVESIINEFGEPGQLESFAKGVRQTASLWRESDGTDEEFRAFCDNNYITNPHTKRRVFDRTSHYLETLYGYGTDIDIQLGWYTTVNAGQMEKIDQMFTLYNPRRRFLDDMFANKIAFYIGLNFPELTLEEKNGLGDDRLAWAYARLGDVFANREPEGTDGAGGEASARGEIYISNYNIHMGKLLDDDGSTIFPDHMVLLSHWNLRDEIKSNYSRPNGIQKQRMVYQVMKRIISQEIPRDVINSPQYQWNPYTNTAYLEGQPVRLEPENIERYQKVIDNFHDLRRFDKPGENTIDRHFNRSMEISEQDVVDLLTDYLKTPELKQVGQIISLRVGRDLEAFDIWYDGFKPRSSIDEEKLSRITRAKYPTAQALEYDIPDILRTLGFNTDKAEYLSRRIAVDNARGSGHAYGPSRKGSKARLRTRIPDGGMDYKGYNIAIHELGHNVEQVISLYDVDHYMMRGVPNTAFTEALAFVFQKRDLEILNIGQSENTEAMDVLDKAWSLYEICGVSLLDIRMWQWLYANPDATAAQLRDRVIALSKEIWNEYYAPVFGTRDETILAIYSHMINYPLYLSAYAFGQIIEFQLENYLQDKDFATEVERIFRQGRLTPSVWMQESTGEPVSPQPLVDALREVLESGAAI